LAEAGYPNGLDAGEFTAIPGFPTVGEAALNYLNAVGIRVKMRPMERAAFYAAWRGKKPDGLFITAVGQPGNGGGPGGRLLQLQGRVRVWGVPGHRRSRPGAGRRARREEARGDAPQDPAADDRPGDVRPDHGSARLDGRRPQDGRSHDQPGADDRVAVLRGHEDQDPVTPMAMDFGIFMEFEIRRGGDQAGAFREGFDVVDAAEAC